MSDFNSSQEVHKINERIETPDQARRIIRRLTDQWTLTERWKHNSWNNTSRISEDESKKLELKVNNDQEF